MKIAVAYDFKRSLLRPVLLVMLVLFALLGVAITYAMYGLFAERFRPVDGIAVRVVAFDGDSVRCIMVGGIIDRRGNPVEGSLTFISNGSRIHRLEGVSMFSIEDPSVCGRGIDVIEVSTQMIRFNISCLYIPARGPGPGGVVNVTAPVSASVCGLHDGELRLDDVLIVFKAFISDLRLPRVRLYAFAVNTSSPGPRLAKPVELNYTLTGLAELTRGPQEPEGTVVIDEGVEHFDLAVERNAYAVTLYQLREKRLTGVSIFYAYRALEEISYIDIVTGYSGLQPYGLFFPVVVLYVVYVFIVKPRSSGALEFVLARPITRFDLYLSRYLAGVLTIASSTAIFMLVTAASSTAILRLGLDPWGYALLYLGMAASLITFYTLCYAIAFAVRPGLYLILAIIMYLFLSILWGLVLSLVALGMGIGIMGREYEELSYTLSYLNPLQFTEFARYHLLLSYGAVGEVRLLNPVLCVAVPVAWNVLLFLVGLQRFRRAVLTS